MSTLVELGFRADTRDLLRARRNMDELSDSGRRTDGTFTSLQRTIGVVGAAFAALGTAVATKQAVDYSESWKMVNNQLRIVVDTEEDLIQTRTKLLGLSKDTSSNLSATTALYAELFRNTRELNTEQSQLLTVTGTLNNLFVAGAKDADTQKSAIRQLSQALGTGALRGDEYISVTEAAPRVIDALATSLNMAKGDMRDFAATGGITSQVLIKALTEYADTAQELFDKTEKTQAQYFENSKTNATEYIGRLEWLSDAVNSFGSGVEGLSENLDSAASATLGFASVIGGAMAVSLAKSAASMISITVSTVAYNIQLARMSGLTGAYAIQAGVATVATRGLGLALSFALGPWGLLIAAVGTAAAVFMTSKDNADELRKSLSEQEKVVSDLERSYKRMTTAQAAESYLSAQKLLIYYDQKRLDIQTKLNDITTSGNIKNFGLIAGLKAQLSDLDESAKAPQQRLEAILNVINGNLLDGEWTNRSGGGDGDKPKTSGKLTDAQKEYNSWLETVTGFQTPLEMAIEKIDRVNKAMSNGLPITQSVINYLANASNELAEFNKTAEDDTYSNWLEKISSESTAAKLQSIQNEITETWLALDGGDLDKSAAMEHIDALEKRAKELKGVLTGSDMFASVSDSAIAGLQSIQGLSAQGSSEYAKLGVAIQAITAAQAVLAVVTQATGDPYTAFPRMAAMAAALLSLGVSVGNVSGGFSDDSAANQASQGLNIWGDKSESISNSIDLTASATDELVGINTDMLSALNIMAADLSSAAALSLREGLLSSPDVSVYENLYSEVMGNAAGDLFKALNPLTLGIGSMIGKFLGGSSSTTDQGIQIVGGTLAQLASDADINAYVDTKYKKWRFGSTKTRTDYSNLDEASAQFSLVFDSLGDAVFEGATNLGLGTSAVTKAINSFRISTREISLKGLSAAAQQTAIENVFSSIFDSLSVKVVPFLSKFQEVGEGLGETLSRVSTQVSITEMLVDSLGITMLDKMADPEMYLTAADNLSTLAGGISEFASKTSSFIDEFAPDSLKFSIYTDAMTAALSDVNLSIPETKDGFFELMQGLDGSTEAGQNQIATLLNLTDTASEYYSLLDNTVGDFNDSLASLTSSIMSTIDSMFGVTYESSLTALDDALMLARAGSFDAALGLDLSSLNSSESDFSSLVDYNIAQAKTGNKLSDLSSLTGSTKTTAEHALSESIEQTSLLTALKEQQAKIAETMNKVVQSTKETVKKLDEMQLDSLPVRIVT